VTCPIGAAVAGVGRGASSSETEGVTRIDWASRGDEGGIGGTEVGKVSPLAGREYAKPAPDKSASRAKRLFQLASMNFTVLSSQQTISATID
jgi:hypothetical protein